MHDHAAKHAIHLQLVDRLRRQAAEVRRLAAGLDETALATPTEAGKWSLKELICHFARMEDVFADRFHRLFEENQPEIVPYAPDGDAAFVALTRRPADQVLADYLSKREALCRQLEALGPEGWHRKGRHPEYPHYDVHFQVEYMAHHEAHHIYQMFQRRVPLGKLPHG